MTTQSDDTTPTVKITQLTPLNVEALRETLTPEELGKVTLGATIAEFAMSPSEAFSMVQAAKKRAAVRTGARFHPAASLSAVMRKLNAAASDQ